jgi:hypothetical protein
MTFGHDGPTTIDGHPLPPPASATPNRLPWFWQAGTWTVFAAACAWVLNSVLAVLLIIGLVTLVLSGTFSDVSPALTDAILEAGALTDSVNFALLVAALGGLAAWRRWSQSLLAGRGAFAPESAVAHWSLRAVTVAAVATLALGFLLTAVRNGLVEDGGIIVLVMLIILRVVRVLAGALLIVAVLSMRRQCQEAVAAIGTETPATAPIRFAPQAPTNAAGIDTTGMRTADDTFWAEVTQLLTTTGTDLPLLESWSSRSRHWRMLSAAHPAESVTAARYQSRRGAVVTVYPRTPEPVDGGAAAVTSIGGGFGLVQDRATGALAFRELSATGVAGWVAQAYPGQRLGLYPQNPADLPGSLTAIVPAS